MHSVVPTFEAIEETDERVLEIIYVAVSRLRRIKARFPAKRNFSKRPRAQKREQLSAIEREAAISPPARLVFPMVYEKSRESAFTASDLIKTQRRLRRIRNIMSRRICAGNY